MTAAPPVWRIVKRTYGDGDVVFVVQRYYGLARGWEDDETVDRHYDEADARMSLEALRQGVVDSSFTDEVLP